jgi:hypothetical protein
MDDYHTICARKAAQFAAQRAEAEADELQPSQRQRSGGEGLVYKTVYNDTPAQQQSGGMDAATEAAWNSWADAKIANAIRELGPEIDRAFDNLADATNKALDDLADEAKKALDDLREKNAKLRNEVEVLRVMVRSQNLGVTRSKRDVA